MLCCLFFTLCSYEEKFNFGNLGLCERGLFGVYFGIFLVLFGEEAQLFAKSMEIP